MWLVRGGGVSAGSTQYVKVGTRTCGQEIKNDRENYPGRGRGQWEESGRAGRASKEKHCPSMTDEGVA